MLSVSVYHINTSRTFNVGHLFIIQLLIIHISLSGNIQLLPISEYHPIFKYAKSIFKYHFPIFKYPKPIFEYLFKINIQTH